jgi:hypothetical protein
VEADQLLPDAFCSGVAVLSTSALSIALGRHGIAHVPYNRCYHACTSSNSCSYRCAFVTLDKRLLVLMSFGSLLSLSVVCRYSYDRLAVM